MGRCSIAAIQNRCLLPVQPIFGSHARSSVSAPPQFRRLQHNLHDTLVRNSIPSAIFQLLPVSTRPALCSVEWHHPWISCSYFSIFFIESGLWNVVDYFNRRHWFGCSARPCRLSFILSSLASLPLRPSRCLRRLLCTLELLLESHPL